MMSARRLGFFGRLLHPLPRISDTSIFARRDGDHQLLAYSMKLRAGEPVAMVLPIPTRVNSPEDAVSFVDLSDAPDFFSDLRHLFEVVQTQAKSGGIGGVLRGPRTLVVHAVGSFDASFVPKMADFARLDERFRLSDEVWKALPGYADFGFVVVKLRKTDGHVHPIAFRFPTREPDRLFFPTVHVHDGEVHAQADFDHTLYYQGERGVDRDTPSSVDASEWNASRSKGLVVAGPMRRRMLRGSLPNEDIYI